MTEFAWRLMQAGLIIVFIVMLIAIFTITNTVNENSKLRTECVNYCHIEGLSYSNYDVTSSECHCNGELNNKVVIIT